MASRERLPEQYAHRPDVRGRTRCFAAKALGRDVRERAGDVAYGRERLVLVHHGEAEVEELDARVRAVREEDVRRLHVAVDDAVRVRVRKPVENLRACFEHGSVVERIVANRFAERPAGNVLVDDVHVARVTGERVSAQAAFVAELRRGACLALGAGSRVAFAGDDLQRHFGAALLLHGQPNRARAPRPEGPDRPVAPEHERSRGDCSGRSRHRHRPLWPCRAELLSHGPGRSMGYSGPNLGPG